jgi:uncharacterized damage-inducible protein DinB
MYRLQEGVNTIGLFSRIFNIFERNPFFFTINHKIMTNKDFFIASWQRDFPVTAKAFRSLPDDIKKLSHSHHPKFRSPWEIVNHIGPHAKEVAQALSEGRMDLVNEGKFDLNAPHIYKNPEDAAKEVEKYSEKLLELAAKTDEDTWMTKQIPVYWGPAKIMEMPLMQVCWMMYVDVIHHRGQLTTYYRTLGIPQPSLMGPTFEEEEAMMASMGKS